MSNNTTESVVKSNIVNNNGELDSLNPIIALQAFKGELGESFGKICADVKSQLGRWEKDLQLTKGEWKCSATGKLTRKDGQSVQMPLNNPASTLLRFGMRLNELAKAGSFEIIATMPKECEFWVNEHRKNKSNVPTPEPVVAAK